MSIGLLLIGLAMLIVSGVGIALPIWRKPVPKYQNSATPQAKGSYRDTLMALRDLEFDYQTGLVAETDYPQLREKLMEQAGQFLVDSNNSVEKIVAEIEAAISFQRQNRRVQKTPNSMQLIECSGCGEKQDNNDKFCANCGLPMSMTCVQCKQPITSTDRFCTTCGSPISAQNGIPA